MNLDRDSPVSRQRATVAALAMCLAVLALTGVALAAEGPRDTTAQSSPPVVVYQGELLDLSHVEQTDTGTPIGAGSVSFVGLAGDADGTFESADSGERIDFDTFAAGTYDTDGDERPEIAVVNPRVTQIRVTSNGVDVTGKRIPVGGTATIAVRYNFDVADRVDVRILDPSGIDVTPEIIGSGNANRITASGDTVTADFTNEEPGAYTIVAEASDLVAEARSTLAVRDRQTVLTLSQSTVTQGERVLATVTGTPGDTVHVRFSGDALGSGFRATDDAAEQVFETSRDVRSRTGNTARNAVGAVLLIDDDGLAQVWITSAALRPDRTARLDLGRGTDFSASVLDSRDLRIERQRLAVQRAPGTVPIGAQFTIGGTAPQSETVKAYVRTDGQWEPLFRDADRYAEARVRSGDVFELTIDTSQVINQPGSYTIAVAGNAREQYGAGQGLSAAQLDQLPFATTAVRTVSGRLTASLSRPGVVLGAGDAVRLTGETPSRTVHVYQVTPRGRLLTAEAVSVATERFERRYSEFDVRGEYRFVVVDPGPNGAFADGMTPERIRARILGSETQPETLAKIIDGYTGTGVDDQIVELRLRAGQPTLDIDPIGEVEPGEVRIGGRSNRAPGTTIALDVRRADTVVATGDTTVGEDGRWTVTVDLADADLGDYTVLVDDGDISTERAISLVEAVPTTETPTDAPTATTTDTPTTDSPASPTGTGTPTATTPGDTGPGFTIGVALVAVLLVLIASRRR